MKALNRRYLTYKLNNLPKLKDYYFDHNGNTGCTGSIVRRPLKGLQRGLWHYAFIYGFDLEGRLLVIENNEDGVRCVYWQDFILDSAFFEFTYLETSLNRFNDIMNRAKERSNYRYEGNGNNCEDFVNFCLFEKLESMQVNNIKMGVDFLLTLFEARIMMIQDEMSVDVLESMKEVRKALKVERKPELADILDRHKLSQEKFYKRVAK